MLTSWEDLKPEAIATVPTRSNRDAFATVMLYQFAPSEKKTSAGVPDQPRLKNGLNGSNCSNALNGGTV